MANKPRLQLGNPIFNRMLFVLKKPVTLKNHLDYRFMNGKAREIAKGVWALPAYLKAHDSHSWFFIFTKIKSGQTVVAFSKGTLAGRHFDLSRPMTTGRGLNLLHRDHPQRAIRAAHFLNLISRAAEGDWRMVTD